MDGYLDFLFVGTILSCAGGNVAHFGSRRLLQVPTGRLIWGLTAIILLASPVILLVRAKTWEVVAASVVGALVGAIIGRWLRGSRYDFYVSLFSTLIGASLLIRADLMDVTY